MMYSPSAGSEGTPFLLSSPSSPSLYRSPPPSPRRLGSFVDAVSHPNLKRGRKTGKWMILFVSLGFVGLLAIGSYAYRTDGMVERRLRDWREGFVVGVESAPGGVEGSRAEPTIDGASPAGTAVVKGSAGDRPASSTEALAADPTSTSQDSQSQNKVAGTAANQLPATHSSSHSTTSSQSTDSSSSSAIPTSSSTTPSSSKSPLIDNDTTPIIVSALPMPRVPMGGAAEKFLGYLPHSGFHNQRIELENALLLGKLLGRTVYVIDSLTPRTSALTSAFRQIDSASLDRMAISYPVLRRLGALARSSLALIDVLITCDDEQQAAWSSMVLINTAAFNLPPQEATSPLFSPAGYASPAELDGLAPPPLNPAVVAAKHAHHLAALKAQWPDFEIRPDGFPITNLTAADCKSYSVECRHTYKDTFLSWDFLIDMGTVAEKVPLVDRFDMREKVIESLLGVEADDIVSFLPLRRFGYEFLTQFSQLVLRDTRRYDFQFVDRVLPGGAMTERANSSSMWANRISIPALAALPQKVLLVGSLFSSLRIIQAGQVEGEWPKRPFSQDMAFRNEYLMRPALAIRKRLGGSGRFVGLHARIGDGTFLLGAHTNMEVSWRKLVKQLDVDSEVMERMWERVKPIPRRRGRSVSRSVVESEWAHLDPNSSDEEEMDDSTSSLHRHSKRALLSTTSDHLIDLSCRAPLHTDPTLLQFNVPLYLATDSRSPTTDSALWSFFNAFPCTFILSDFSSPGAYNRGIVEETVGEMTRLVNGADGIGLGRLMIPFLEAMIAAMAGVTVGTTGSTFSGQQISFSHFRSILTSSSLQGSPQVRYTMRISRCCRR